MSERVIIYLRNPRNSGMTTRAVTSRLGTKTLHQTVLDRFREYSREKHGENFVGLAMQFATNPAHIGNVVNAEGVDEEKINKAIAMVRKSGGVPPSFENGADATGKEAIKGVQTASGNKRSILEKGLEATGNLGVDVTNDEFTPQ